MRETEARNGAINWRVIGDFWAWVFTGRRLGRKVNMRTIFSERHGVDTDEPEWVGNLRAEYERRIADLQTENDQNQILARMIFEEYQEIAQLWRRKVNAQEESIDQMREEQDRLWEQVDAYRREIDRLQIELERRQVALAQTRGAYNNLKEMYRQVLSEKEEHR